MNFCYHCGIYTPFSECFICKKETEKRYEGYKSPFLLVRNKHYYPVLNEKEIENLLSAKISSHLKQHTSNETSLIIPILKVDKKKMASMFVCHKCKNIIITNSKKKKTKCSCGELLIDIQKIIQPFQVVSSSDKNLLWALVPHLWIDCKVYEEFIEVVDEFSYGFVSTTTNLKS